jgi:hypothetical protein
MTEPDRPVPGWLAPDEPRFRTVEAPDDYPKTTEGPVVWAPVTKQDELIGYVWAAERDDAADFLLRPGHPRKGLWLNTSVAWVDRLRAARAQGLRPTEALARWASAPDAEAGTLGATSRAESLDDFRAAVDDA